MENKSFNSDWIAVLLLCLFLGVFGAHHFFAKNTQKAVTMLLITFLLGWVFGFGILITSIWAIYDLIMIICGKFTNGEGKIIPMQI